MKSPIANMPQQKATRIAGLGLLTLFFLGLFSILVVLNNFIVPGDTTATASKIMDNPFLFYVGIAGFLAVLALDVVVALMLYVVLKPVNRSISLLTALFRLLYTVVMLAGVLSLAMLFVDGYTYGELVAYAFFIPHLFFLGYLVYRSGYIPRIIGILLIITSFCYVIMLYGDYFLTKELLDILYMIAFLPAVVSETLLGIWLLLKGIKMPGTT